MLVFFLSSLATLNEPLNTQSFNLAWPMNFPGRCDSGVLEQVCIQQNAQGSGLRG